MTRTPKKKQLESAWAAGLIVSKGKFTRNTSGGKVLRVRLIDEDVIERLQQIFGTGTVHVKHTPSGKRTWIWEVSPRAVAEVMRRVLPSLALPVRFRDALR